MCGVNFWACFYEITAKALQRCVYRMLKHLMFIFFSLFRFQCHSVVLFTREDVIFRYGRIDCTDTYAFVHVRVYNLNVAVERRVALASSLESCLLLFARFVSFALALIARSVLAERAHVCAPIARL